MVGNLFIGFTLIWGARALVKTDATQDVGMRAALANSVFDETDEVLAGLPDVGQIQEDQLDLLADIRPNPTETFDLLVEIQSSVSMDIDAFEFNLDSNLRDNFRIAVASVIKRVKSAAAVENIEAGEIDGETVISYSVSVPMQGSGQAGPIAEAALFEIKSDLATAITEGSLEAALHSHDSNFMLHVEHSLRLTNDATATYTIVRGVPEPSNISKRSVIDDEAELAEAEEARRILDEEFSFSFNFVEEEVSLETIVEESCRTKTVRLGRRFIRAACPLLTESFD